MAHITASVEYGLHCLLWLIGKDEAPMSTRDLADLQGISSAFLAKIMAKLEKAGVVRATEGARGGYVLARSPAEISFLAVVDAIEGRKPLFDCQEIRGRCAVFEGNPPGWAMGGVCAVHAVMLQAEKAMRQELAKQSLADVAQTFLRVAPPDFTTDLQAWIDRRSSGRSRRSDPADPVPSK